MGEGKGDFGRDGWTDGRRKRYKGGNIERKERGLREVRQREKVSE